MRIRPLRSRIFMIFLLLLLAAWSPLLAQPNQGTGLTKDKSEAGKEQDDPDKYVGEDGKVVRRVWTTTKLKRWLESATAQYEGLPAEADPDSHQGRMRKALGLRIELFKELLSTRESVGGVGSAQQALVQERERIEQELKTLQGAAEPQAPKEVDREQLEAQEKRLSEARQKLADAERHSRERDERLKVLPEERTAADDRLQKAGQLLRELPGKIESSKSDSEKDYLNLLLKNARLEHRLAEEHLLWLEREQELLEEGNDLDEQQILGLQLELARTEQEVSLYRKAQGIQLEKKKKEVDEEVARQEEAVEQATTPQEKFLASWQARLAKEQATLIELEQTANRWAELESTQENSLQAEKKELEALTELTAQSEGGRTAGLRLKATFQRIKERSGAVSQPVVSNLAESMDQFRTQQLEVQESLQHLDDEWSERVEKVAGSLPESTRGAFRATAVGSREQVRSALMEKRKLLDKVVGLGDRLEMFALERVEVLETLEDLVLSQVFWIRDARPLGHAVFSMVGGELGRQVDWMGDAFGELFSGNLTRGVSVTMLVLWIAILFLVVPALLILVQLRLGRMVRNRTEDAGGGPTCREQTWGQRGGTLVLAFARAVPLPLYGILLGWWVAGSGFPMGIDLVLSRLLIDISSLLFVWLLARAMLGRQCLSEVIFSMNAEAVSALYRFSLFLIFSWLFLMVPADIWQRAPFEFEALPRLAYTLFYLLAMVALWPLLRKASPLVKNLTGGTPENPWWRAWNAVAISIMSLLVAILVMDVIGFRFGAGRMARSAALSLFTVFLVSALYRFSLQVLDRTVKGHERDLSGAPGEETAEQDAVRYGRLRRFLKTAFVVLGLAVVAIYWGVSAGAFGALEKMTVTTFHGAAGEVETLAVSDLLTGLLILMATIWIVRNLKGILDVFVFPRFDLAQGSRYAVMTITRWALFVLGIMITFSAIHLDLGKIGWLVAAMGVGIGFGLQEIIANMVSGVILLIERPIRVGDLLTVGEISGEVRRINIRATTILNFDRQEVIVPNKDFITKEVTNWTLADRVMRVVIKIGVAYGSDVDEVRKMLISIAREQSEVRTYPAPVAFFMDHGESSLDFQLFVYLTKPEDRHIIRDRINTLINKGLKERGIEIPFPQRDLHVRSGELPVHLEDKRK